MSKELQALERRASAQCITDRAHIDKIMRYMLALPFSSLRREERFRRYLRNDLSKGFQIVPEALDGLPLEDVLLLVGFAPEELFFAPPDRRFDKSFYSAGPCYALAHMICSLAKTDARANEFLHIGVSAFVGYLRQQVEDGVQNGRIAEPRREVILRHLKEFQRMARERTRGDDLGTLIRQTLTVCDRPWMCFAISLDMFSEEVINGYDLLNRLFADCIRTALIPAGRERFWEIVTEYGNVPPSIADAAGFGPGGEPDKHITKSE